MRPGDQRVSIEGQAQRRHPAIRKSGAEPLPIRSARHQATPLADQYTVDRSDVNPGRVGRVDDNWQHPDKAKSHDLRDAIEAVLAHKKLENPVTHAIGCTIKWKM